MRPAQRERKRNGQVKRRLNSLERVFVIRDKLSGHTTGEVAKRYNVSRWTVQRLMAMLGIVVMLCSFGCDQPHEAYRARPVPAQESPVVNPPLAIRQSNWRGPKGEGSCVHASLTNMLRWQNEFELADAWRARYKGDGEHASELRSRLDEMGIKYAYTNEANLALLDFAHETRQGALLWWKPNHCCTFCGWVEGPSGITYAVILDNNSVDHYELIEINEFHRAWASFGGFALTVLGSPPSLPPYRSYDPVE